MLLVVSFAALWALSAAASVNPRIVQGDVADKGEVPWQLSLQLDGSHICGAVAIAPDFVLTAAHCVDFAGYEASRFRFVCGLHDLQNDPGQVAVAQTIVMHEQYDANALGFPNDIAIVKVDPPFQFNAECVPARLPLHNEKDYAGKNSTISGWGRLWGDGPIATLLKKAHIPVITNQECSRDYIIIIINPIRNSHICVKDPNRVKGACNGDSGGPLTTIDLETGNPKVTGLTSFGKAGCDTNSASVYTRVSSYLSWITNKMAQLQ